MIILYVLDVNEKSEIIQLEKSVCLTSVFEWNRRNRMGEM